MIEVERKFTVGGDDEKRLLEGADFLLEKTLMDVYYDTPDYALSTKDMWLRTRDGRWELKVPLMERTGVRRAMDQYDELEDEVKTARANYLKLAKTLSRERQQAAGKLGKAVTQHMQELGMPGGKFEVQLQPLPAGELSAHGLERIEFLFRSEDVNSWKRCFCGRN